MESERREYCCPTEKNDTKNGFDWPMSVLCLCLLLIPCGGKLAYFPSPAKRMERSPISMSVTTWSAMRTSQTRTCALLWPVFAPKKYHLCYIHSVEHSLYAESISYQIVLISNTTTTSTNTSTKTYHPSISTSTSTSISTSAYQPTTSDRLGRAVAS